MQINSIMVYVFLWFALIVLVLYIRAIYKAKETLKQLEHSKKLNKELLQEITFLLSPTSQYIKMNLPELVFVNSKELPGGEVILHTLSPYMAARVFKFESGDAMEDFIKKHNLFGNSVHVPGYNILICYVGTIHNISEKVMLGHNVPSEAKQFLQTATEFYEKERIEGNESRQKKYAR